MAGCTVHLMSEQAALDAILRAASGEADRALGVASANLDHVYHFGRGSDCESTLVDTDGIAWLTLLDGIPLVARAKYDTGVSWPRLAGSDLLAPLLERAQADGIRVGFLGGRSEMHRQLRTRLARTYPDLVVAGCWDPSPRDLDDPALGAQLACSVALAQAHLLVVSLGKPRQELWIQRCGEATGARVLLAFGASADFLAGRVKRAPRLLRAMGLEWAYRLALEPRRLWRRYLLNGPIALRRLVRG